MCFFKRKKKIVIDSKFHIGDLVRFKYRDDSKLGYIYEIKLNEANEVIYHIQCGGECPSFFDNIPENIVVLVRPNMQKQ